jgi:hypothetical protein
MKTFFQWAETKKLELPVLGEQPPAKGTVDEKQTRSGIAHWAYPDSYARQQYPDGYFMPKAADAVQKMGKHQPSRKAAPTNTPG